MSKTPAPDFKGTSTIGLGIGAFIFLGLGFYLVFDIIYNSGRIISGGGIAETFAERLIVIMVALGMFITGFSFIIIGVLCFYHFRLRRKLKRELRARMSKDGDQIEH